MISLEEAKDRVLAAVTRGVSEAVPLREAAGRWAARSIVSTIDLPLFDNSAMDGYAVRAEDVKTTSFDQPARLRCIAKIAAGEFFTGKVEQGACVRLFTGSPMPAGADAVVMQEDTRADGDDILVLDAAKPLENVRLKGEDIRAGTQLSAAGIMLTPAHCGLLGACGVAQAEVVRKPRVALLATGNELRAPGETLRPGEIYESNRVLLAALLEQIGAHVFSSVLVRDTLGETVAALDRAFATSDLVITTGGVSVGEFDHVKQAFTELGGQIDLWRIAIRPGKPFVFGRRGGKILFGLPGNPVSAFVTFMVLVRPAVLKMLGAAQTEMPAIHAELAGDLLNRGDRRHFMRVRWDGQKLFPAAGQASHMIGSLAQANALVDVPPATLWKTGDRVLAQIWALPA